MSIRTRVIAAGGIALAALVAVPLPASATQGSVPAEVAAFVAAPDGLVAGLEDFFGPGANGKGIDFDETTELGAIDRVFVFTPDWLAGAATESPVGLDNRWAVPVGVGGEPVGVAVVWINPATVRPQLADFLPDPAFAAALPGIADDGWLVSDPARGAWFALAPPTLTALVTGSSGVAGDTSLSSYQAAVSRPSEAPASAPNPGSVLSVATIVGVVLVVVLVLLLPAVRRRRGAGEAEPELELELEPAEAPEPVDEAEGEADPAPAETAELVEHESESESEPEAEPEPEPEPEEAPHSEPAQETEPAPKPKTKTKAKPKKAPAED